MTPIGLNIQFPRRARRADAQPPCGGEDEIARRIGLEVQRAGGGARRRRDVEQIAGAGVICAATETHCRDCV